MSLTKLKSAVRSGDLKLLKELLHSSESATSSSDLLSLACVHGHQDILSFLIEEKEVDENFGKNALMKAVENEHAALVKKLVCEYKVDVQSYGENSIIKRACQKGDSEIVKIVLDNSSVTSNEEEMHSLLLAAVEENRHVEVVLHLLEKKAKIIRESSDSSALTLACKKGKG